jgi:hypothetical protein
VDTDDDKEVLGMMTSSTGEDDDRIFSSDSAKKGKERSKQTGAASTDVSVKTPGESNASRRGDRGGKAKNEFANIFNLTASQSVD